MRAINKRLGNEVKFQWALRGVTIDEKGVAKKPVVNLTEDQKAAMEEYMKRKVAQGRA